MRGLALVGLVAIAGCTTTPRQAEQASRDQAARAADIYAELATELAGLVPGQPEACMPQPARVQSTTRGYGSTIVYRVSSTVKFRNDTTGGCENVGRGNFFVTQNPLARSCRGDIVQVFDPQTRVPLGSCALGDFVPYRRP